MYYASTPLSASPVAAWMLQQDVSLIAKHSRMALLLSPSQRTVLVDSDEGAIFFEEARQNDHGVDPKDGQVEISPDLAISLGFIQAADLEARCYQAWRLRGCVWIANLHCTALVKGMMQINPALSECIVPPASCVKVRGAGRASGVKYCFDIVRTTAPLHKQPR